MIFSEISSVSEEKASYFPRAPKLLDRLCEAFRTRHYSITMLPDMLKSPLQDHLKKVKTIHEKDLAEPMSSTAAGAPGFARGSTSAVLARGYKPRASGEPKARPLTVGRPGFVARSTGFEVTMEGLMLIRIRCFDKIRKTIQQAEIEPLRQNSQAFPKVSYTAIKSMLGVLYGSI